MEALQAIYDGTPLVVPVTGDAYSTQRLNLDGQAYTLRLAWNQLEASWHLSLYDAEESPIVQGLRVTANWPLFRWYKYDTRMPPGEMVAEDLTGDGSPPCLDDFGEGKRVVLIYYAQTA